MTRLPPYVQRVVRRNGMRFRGWAVVAGRRVYTPWTDSPESAYTAALRLRQHQPTASPTLDAAMATVLQETAAKRSPGTFAWYRDQFAAIGKLIPKSTPLVAVTPAVVEQLVRDRLTEVSAATVNAHLRALHRVFAVAIRHGWSGTNPVQHLDRPRAATPPMDWFPADELADILARVDLPDRDLLTLFAYTGMRRSEVARLAPGHVNLRTMTIYVLGKTGTRVMPVAPDLVGPLSRMRLPVSLAQIDRTFARVRRRLRDRRIHPHAFRHSFAAALVRQGERVDVVRHLLGHRSLQMTLRYWHECGRDAADAVGRLRLLPPPGAAEGSGN